MESSRYPGLLNTFFVRFGWNVIRRRLAACRNNSNFHWLGAYMQIYNQAPVDPCAVSTKPRQGHQGLTLDSEVIGHFLSMKAHQQRIKVSCHIRRAAKSGLSRTVRAGRIAESEADLLVERKQLDLSSLASSFQLKSTPSASNPPSSLRGADTRYQQGSMFTRQIRDNNKPATGAGRDSWVPPGPGHFSPQTDSVQPRVAMGCQARSKWDAASSKPRPNMTSLIPQRGNSSEFSSFNVK